jgi:hypothetical protein
MAATQGSALGEAGYRVMPFLRLVQDPALPAGLFGARLRQAGYAQARAGVEAADVQGVLAAYPALRDAWLGYAEAKTSPDGWYVTRDAEVGQLARPAAQRRFASIDAAVAQFILHELDYHAGIAPAGGGR